MPLVYHVLYMQRYIWWTLLALTVCLLCSAALWYTQQNIVVRLSTGFYPKVIRVQPNESIRFINLTRLPSWPASGPHPTHTTYSEFDPQDGIPFGGSWTFTFTREGTYPFHDHNAPQMTGIVISGNSDYSEVIDYNTCTDLPDEAQQAACVEIYYRNITTKESFQRAREIFHEITALYPGSCHTFAHDLGKNAYSAYLDGQMPDIDSEASSCGYGFWHGFTTAMQSDRGLVASKEFCSSLGGSTETLQNANRMNCYHGVGIGLIPDPPPDHLYGDFQALVTPALTFCDTVPVEGFYRERCQTGIFHAMTIYMMDELYGLTFTDDSLSFCAQQRPEHQEACFMTLVAAVPEQSGFELARTVDILRGSVPADLFDRIFLHAAIIFVEAEAPLEETGRFMQTCTSLGDELRPLCLAAVINKLYNNGIPGSEYEKAFSFCSSKWVKEDEHFVCFKDVVAYANNYYAAEKVRIVCDEVYARIDVPIEECELAQRQ
jgi:hypothetical protein